MISWLKKSRGFCKTWKLAEFKYFEFQIDWRSAMVEWFYLNIETRTDCDHKGFYAGFALLRLLYIGLTFYDSRHKEDDGDPFFDDYQPIYVCGNPSVPPTERAYYATYYEDQDIIRIFWDWGGYAKPEGVYYDDAVGKRYKIKHLTVEGLSKHPRTAWLPSAKNQNS